MDVTWFTNLLSLVGQVLYPVSLVGAIILVAVRAKGTAKKLGLAGFIVFAMNWLGQRVLYSFVSEVFSGRGASLSTFYAVTGFGSTLLSLLGVGLLALAVCAHPRPGPSPAATTMR
ncbi:MAG: hypothetical protein ACTH2Q_13315 [Propionibacteriaceae bacterium]